MFDIADLPLWGAGLLLVILPTALSALGPVIVRRAFGFERIKPNNEVAGFKFAVLGVIYAVILAFTVIVVWERFADAEHAASKEAAAVATLYRLSDGIPQAPRADLRAKLDDYLKAAVSQEWKTMERGDESPAAQAALTTLYGSVLAIQPQDNADTVLLKSMFDELTLLTQARRERIVLANGIVPALLWAVLIVGAIITVGFTLFFGSQNLSAQVVMTAMLALLIFMTMFVVFAIDYPFGRHIRVQPDSLVRVMNDFD
ncbi:DUF4239 domain-containing protein [soil metagenome]